jgi:plasmid stabilization system protein ParE
MPLKEVIWTNRAIKGIFSIRDFIAKSSKSAAEKVVDRIFDREEQLQTYPDSGTIETRLRLKKEYRYIIESHYKIIYREGKNNIYVVRVFDTRQSPKKINK